MLSREHIEEYYLPYMSIGSRGSKSKDIVMVVQAILYRLKTGCQWRLLPMRELAESAQLRWITVYYHFRRWVADGSFRRLWVGLLRRFKHCLDLSSIQLDGSQTLVKRGGQAVGYQHRKSGNTTNILLLSDNSGIPVSVCQPIEGNHHDVYKIAEFMNQIFKLLREAEIEIDGLFLNADAGFDTAEVRQVCQENGIIANIDLNPRNGSVYDREEFVDQELYKRRTAIERTNAWIDAYKALFVRYETQADTWFSLHLLAFSVIFLRKIRKFKLQSKS